MLAGSAVLLVAAAALWWLGGDDGRAGDGGDTRQAILTACSASNESIGAAQRALLRGNEAPTAVEGFLGDAFVDLARERASALRALDPSDEVERVLTEQDAVVDGIEADPAGAAASVDNPFEAVNAQWRALGLSACAIDATTVPA